MYISPAAIDLSLLSFHLPFSKIFLYQYQYLIHNFCFCTDLGKAKLNLDFAMKNLTKYKGENIRIRCEISGNPLPRYKWFKDDVPIRENEDRINSKLTPWGAR